MVNAGMSFTTATRVNDALAVLSHIHVKDALAEKCQLCAVGSQLPIGTGLIVPPDRGTITLSEDRFWWLAVIERPGQLKHDDRFLQLEEAVVWVEQQIPELRAQDEEWKKNWEREKAEEAAKIAALPKKDLTPYWIDPADLDSKRITYRALIQVDYVPYSSKPLEISFGQQWHFNKEYYPPTMLAHA